MPSEILYLEDLSIGQRFVSSEYVVREEEIKEFAGRFDPQPFHLDCEAAKGTFFAGLAASGWHTAAITMRLMVESVKIAGGMIGAGGQISWPKPTRPNDVLHVESEIVEITPSRSRPDRGMATVRSTTINQDGETVQIFDAKVVVPRRGDQR